jgi:hypothetical protein
MLAKSTVGKFSPHITFIVVFMVGTIYYSYQLVSMGVSDADDNTGQHIVTTAILIVDFQYKPQTLSIMSYFPGVWNFNFLLL